MTKTDIIYTAVLGDAVGSRDLSSRDRSTLQERIRTTLDVVNRRWGSHIAAPFAIVLGDQFEGLMVRDAPLWDVLHFLRAELGGVDWVMACARGGITTQLATSAAQVDGPCFHLAREALERGKAEQLVLSVAGFDEDSLDALTAYYSALYWSWTARQREVAGLLRIMDPAAVAARLSVDRSAVSHIASRLRWAVVSVADRAFRRRLEAP
jgi:hypothetical protein